MAERSEYVVYRAKRIWYLAHELALVSWIAAQPFPHLLINSRASQYLECDRGEIRILCKIGGRMW
jgi:hypothetical protein